MEFKSLLVSYMLFMLISILISSNVLLASGSMINSGGAGGFGGSGGISGQSGGISGQSGGISGQQMGPQFPLSQGAMTEGDLQQLLQSFLQCTQSPQQLMQPQCIQIIQQSLPILPLGQSPDQMQYLSPETQQLLQQAIMQGAQLLQQVGPSMQMQQQPPFQQQPFPPTQQLPPQGMLPQQPQQPPSPGLFSFRSGPTTAQPFTMLILEPRGNTTGEEDIVSSLLSFRGEGNLTFNNTSRTNMTLTNETAGIEPKTFSFLRNTAELLLPSNDTSFQNITQPNIAPITNETTNTLDSNLTKSKRGR